MTGGAGYVGARLVPKLLEAGYRVRVIDLYLFEPRALQAWERHPRLEQVRGDIRDARLLEGCLDRVDAVIHLACVSNDSSYDLNPRVAHSINCDAHVVLVDMAKQKGVRRFVFASSSSVYGLKDENKITEDLAPEPVTGYSKSKAFGEAVLLERQGRDFTAVILRPATVCGYSPRMRLDLVLNIFAHQAILNERISVFGGSQKRPNIHIEDMADAYLAALAAPPERIDGKIFNVGAENLTLTELAQLTREALGNPRIRIESVPSKDMRSYHIHSERIQRELGFAPRRNLQSAVKEIEQAFQSGLLPDSSNHSGYYNLKRMQEVEL